MAGHRWLFQSLTLYLAKIHCPFTLLSALFLPPVHPPSKGLPFEHLNTAVLSPLMSLLQLSSSSFFHYSLYILEIGLSCFAILVSVLDIHASI